MEPGWDGDIELYKSGYWDVGLGTGVHGGNSVGVGGSDGVDGTDGVGSGGGVGCGDSDRAESVGRSHLRVEYCGFVSVGGGTG